MQVILPADTTGPATLAGADGQVSGRMSAQADQPQSSVLQDAFAGEELSINQCLDCDSVTQSCTPILDISAPLPDKAALWTTCSLKACQQPVLLCSM